MNTKQHIDVLFSGYEETPTLADFKEELQSNLCDRIKNLIEKGHSEKVACEKALDELGDISALAEELSLKKRREVFEEMYMKTRNYMDKWHIFGYTIAGGLLTLGIILSLLAYLATGDIKAGLGSAIIFFIIPLAALVFLGLTQETARDYPMHWKRALCYAAVAVIILFGLDIFLLAFFAEHNVNRVVASLGALIPFALPGCVALTYLMLTEKSRHKPWVIEQETAWMKKMNDQFTDPYTATRFGLFSGALWIFAAAMFVVLGFLVGFMYSWVVFLFAIAVQILIQALMTPKERK